VTRLSIRLQWTLLGFIVAVITAGTWLGTARPTVRRVTVGDTAPSFPHLRGVNAASKEASDPNLGTGPRVIVVWASWCPACRAEMPSLQRLFQQFGPMGLRMTAVSVDPPSGVTAVWQIVREAGITFDVVLDPSGLVGRSYGVGPIPQAFFVSRDGIIQERLVGERSWTDPALIGRVRALVGPTAPPISGGRVVAH